ncbi:hypothetical protein FS749_009157 [Ceratobasidium sp. UAMH 11750]|nr:hypothetical protein FS749_009157 [Ceratobasidium sp. UAMH 11750]
MRNPEVAGASTAVEGQENRTSEHKREGKLRRRSRACTVCSKLKIRCKPMSGVGDSGEGAPCMRCWETGQECIFRESQRGKDQARKIALLQKQLDHMKETCRLLEESLDNQSSSRYHQLGNPQ